MLALQLHLFAVTGGLQAVEVVNGFLLYILQMNEHSDDPIVDQTNHVYEEFRVNLVIVVTTTHVDVLKPTSQS